MLIVHDIEFGHGWHSFRRMRASERGWVLMSHVIVVHEIITCGCLTERSIPVNKD